MNLKNTLLAVINNLALKCYGCRNAIFTAGKVVEQLKMALQQIFVPLT